jgi:hypothetical protein
MLFCIALYCILSLWGSVGLPAGRRRWLGSDGRFFWLEAVGLGVQVSSLTTGTCDQDPPVTRAQESITSPT